MTTETASVVFTDIVGSTALTQRLGADRAQAFLRTHDTVMRAAIEGAGGRLVKSLGDGVMAVFTSSADAIEGAVAAQRAAEQHGRDMPDEAFAIRAGISVGDIAEDAGDYFGTAVFEAARLCDAAQGGQILLSDLVRQLARGRGEYVFESVGELVLKGLDGPVAACWVGWEPLAPTAQTDVPFPPLLIPTTTVAYSGRPGLLADMQKAWDRVTTGAGSQTLLLVGEPGIGKTRTASELARQAHDAGAFVLYGRCDEELALPYEPFVEALDHQTRHAPQLSLGRFAGDLVRLVPDLGERVEGLPPAISSDPRAEEHRLFDAVASWISTASYDRPIILVVDDLHWATRPTLQMLVHVIRESVSDNEARVLLVATYRDTDVDRTHPLSAVLADLRRLPGVKRLPVDPLSEGEVIDLIQLVAGHELDDTIVRLARRAHEETEGNPFFVGEVLRHFVESGAVRFEGGHWVVDNPDHIDVPEGVRDVVGRRLNRLSDTANQVLTAAAVIGRDFSLQVVASVSRVDVDDALDALDTACAARLIEETGNERFRFAHALTRTTLYEELSATRRRRLHRRIVEALETLRPSDLAALARHSLEAGAIGGDLSSAIGYSLAAGEQALQSRAVADAAGYFEQALEMLEDTIEPAPHQGLQAQCGLGEARRDMGDQSHRQLLLDVTRGAMTENLLALAARAALANGRVFGSVIGAVDDDRVEQLEAVLARRDQLDTATRAALTAALAAEFGSDPDALERRLQLADEAVALAEASGDDALLARVWAATSNPQTVPERLDDVEAGNQRALALADAGTDPTMRLVLRGTLAYLKLTNGDLAGSRRLSEESSAFALAEGTPTTQWFARNFAAQFLAWGGDIAGARAEAAACLELGQTLGEPDAINWWGGLEFGLRNAEGTLHEIIPLIDESLLRFPKLRGWPPCRAYAAIDADDLEGLRGLVDTHGLDRPDFARGGLFELAVISSQATVLWTLRDDRALAGLAPLLRGHEHRWSTNGLWLWAPLHTAVAMCAVACGDLAAADIHARAAWAQVVDHKVRPIVPLTALYAQELLQAVGSPDALAAGRAMLEHGLEEARDMEMTVRAAQLESALAGA